MTLINLTDDEIENWAGGRPTNPTTEQGVRMALELRDRRKQSAAMKPLLDVLDRWCESGDMTDDELCAAWRAWRGL